MTTYYNTAASTTAATMATIAAIEAHEAKEKACATFEMQYDPKVASTVNKQQYAECIELLYPSHTEWTEHEVSVLKSCMSIGLLFWFVVIVFAFRDNYNDAFDKFMIGILGGAIGGLIVGGLSFIVYAIGSFLIS